MSNTISFGVFGLMLAAVVAHFWAQAIGNPTGKRIAGIIKLVAYCACVTIVGIALYQAVTHLLRR
jgi:hypothetical protein